MSRFDNVSNRDGMSHISYLKSDFGCIQWKCDEICNASRGSSCEELDGQPGLLRYLGLLWCDDSRNELLRFGQDLLTMLS